MLVQFIINGIINGAIYALVALGFALVYNTTKIFHIAYATLYMVAPYFLYSFYKLLGLDFFVSVCIAIILTIILSLLIHLSVYRPLERKHSSLNVILIASLGVMIVIINVVAMFYGNETKIINSGLADSVTVGKVIITYPQLYQFIFSSLLLALFFIFLKYTKFGIETRALRDNEQLSKVFALDIDRLKLYLYGFSGLFAAVGGILMAYDVGFDPYVGMPMFLNALVALIIGGVGKFYTPIIGGIIIGLLQAFVIWKFSANWADVVSFTLLILFLLFRPQGLFGEKQRRV